ncbi:hypothetical protein BBP40_004822 [Aspergillus hancockii]|nr:hypothetical protein BBP40_004822 [Aspergillus hancockii]
MPTAVAIMFVGYLLGQIPGNTILTRVRPFCYIPAAIVWDGTSICMAAAKDYAGIVCVRIFLGFAKSPFFPGAQPLSLQSVWAIVNCRSTVANGFGGMLAAGILSGLEGKGGFAGWRWLFIIESAGAMAAGLAANNEVDENGSIKQGLMDAVSDPKVWALVLLQVCQLSSQNWTYFFPSIVEALGSGKFVTLLITTPVHVFRVLTSLGKSLVANRTNYRTLLIVWPLCIDIVGNVMVISSRPTAVRSIGMFLMCSGSYAAFNVVQAWVASTIPRTRTKRAIVYAMVNLLGTRPISTGHISSLQRSHHSTSQEGLHCLALLLVESVCPSC